MDMRNIIRLVEAASRGSRKSQASRPVDYSALRTLLSEVIATLAREPFAVRYDRSISDALLETVNMLRAQNLRDVQEEPGTTPMTLNELMQEAMERVPSHFGRVGTDDFNFVRGEVDHEEHGENNQGGGYQGRRAEAAGREDDLDFHVEDSDYLRGMSAQKALASSLVHRDYNDAAATLDALATIRRFASAFEDHSTVTDGGEAPFLVDSMRAGLAKLLPLLKLRWTTAS